MVRTIPFLILGSISLLGFTMTTQPDPSALSKNSLTMTQSDSVEIVAGLDHASLKANQTNSVFSRIQLTGVQDEQPRAQLPVSLTVIIDTSGSMSGDKIRNARESADAVIRQLNPSDRISVVSFSSTANVLIEGSVKSSLHLPTVRNQLSSLQAGGGTNMKEALHVGGHLARSIYHEEHINRVLLLSDGRPDSEHGLVDQVRALAQHGILTTTLGIGRGYNEDLMAQLADAGLANYYFVMNSSDMTRIFKSELSALSSVVAKEARLTLKPKAGVVIEHVYGFPFERHNDAVIVPVGELYSLKTSDVLVRLHVPAMRGSQTLVDLQVTYHDVRTNQAAGTTQALSATFTESQSDVDASANLFVLEKRQKVDTANVLSQVSEYFARGESKKAKELIGTQRDVLVGQAKAHKKDERIQENASALLNALEGLEEAAEAPAADMSVLKKAYKGRGRALIRQ